MVGTGDEDHGVFVQRLEMDLPCYIAEKPFGRYASDDAVELPLQEQVEEGRRRSVEGLKDDVPGFGEALGEPRQEPGEDVRDGADAQGARAAGASFFDALLKGLELVEEGADRAKQACARRA